MIKNKKNKSYDSIFDKMFSNTREIFARNKSLIYQASIILAILSLINTGASMIDFQNQGASFLESLDQNNDLQNSFYVNLISSINFVFNKIIVLSLLIFFYYKIKDKNQKLKESINYLFQKFPILILTFLLF